MRELGWITEEEYTAAVAEELVFQKEKVQEEQGQVQSWFVDEVIKNVLNDLVEQKGWVHFNAQIRHEVYAEEGSVLYRLFGPKFRTNSTHHQAVKDLAPGFHVTARSVEGIVEAYEHDTLPILATQFHPERLTGILWDDRTPDFRPWFEYFVELVRKHAEK